MIDTNNRLELTAQEIDMIEAALHTQKKILSVQSEAGGKGARHKLRDLKRLLHRVGHARREPDQSSQSGWLASARTLMWSPTVSQKP